jgi:hypothetical protein
MRTLTPSQAARVDDLLRDWDPQGRYTRDLDEPFTEVEAPYEARFPVRVGPQGKRPAQVRCSWTVCCLCLYVAAALVGAWAVVEVARRVLGVRL